MVVSYKDYDIEYGSVIHVHDKQEVPVGTKLAEWDPNNKVIAD